MDTTNEGSADAGVLYHQVCRYCGSPDVFADAYAEWSFERQEWLLSATFDKGAHCEDCDGEGRIEAVEDTADDIRSFLGGLFDNDTETDTESFDAWRGEALDDEDAPTHHLVKRLKELEAVGQNIKLIELTPEQVAGSGHTIHDLEVEDE